MITAVSTISNKLAVVRQIVLNNSVVLLLTVNVNAIILSFYNSIIIAFAIGQSAA